MTEMVTMRVRGRLYRDVTVDVEVPVDDAWQQACNTWAAAIEQDPDADTTTDSATVHEMRVVRGPLVNHVLVESVSDKAQVVMVHASCGNRIGEVEAEAIKGRLWSLGCEVLESWNVGCEIFSVRIAARAKFTAAEYKIIRGTTRVEDLK